jgi:hypothetical protein
MKKREIFNIFQNQGTLKSSKLFSFSMLIGISIPIFFVQSVSAGHQTFLTSAIPISSQSSTEIGQKRSLPSETTHISQLMGSGGSLRVSNGTNRNAYVKLVELRSRTLVGALYVKANSTLTLNQIPDGTYQVLFVLGEGWNPNTQSFTKNKYFAKFNQSLNFTTMQLGNSIQYRVFQLTLHPVAGGKARTSGVNEQEFNRY